MLALPEFSQGAACAAAGEPTLDDKVRFLGTPATYGPGIAAVDTRETHMSWVFLAGDRVYKLKKPVRFAYLDFSTLDRRSAACCAEHRLNRRLAPDTYLGVAPLTAATTGLEISGSGRIVDWLVVMKRLRDDETLDRALRSGALGSRELDRVAATLEAFYAHADRVLFSADHELAVRHSALRDDCRVLLDARFGLPLGTIERIAHAQRRFLAARADLIVQRIRARQFVDAHGDLRPEHIWLCEPITIIDCLEFDAQLRAGDPLDEVAFLHLECERLGRRWAGERIRRRLAHTLREDPTNGLFEFYRSRRAMLRARLSIAHLFDQAPRTPDRWPHLARAYLALAAADTACLERLLGDERPRVRTPKDR
ncbi:MAG: hypothetical protein P4M07_13020 [Xanthobacteraceae bacterium]|nr:hypothetical protein [Xanthobacteraceae bacterium]